ncbi:MAG TPA: LuxR C-terminal-related transcriptional regulator [Burkholderiaceae bacterium]|jgi:DNA-binding CsgD family transcriptional regulator|nr:LuxR C-terminal-related transcriptional regulator [Burkholderiaceae bacterium]
MNALEAVAFAHEAALYDVEDLVVPPRHAPFGLPDFGPPLLNQILDELDVGIVVTEATGRVRFANRSALRSCEHGGPCRIVQGVVKAAQEHEELGFVRALRQAADGRRSLLTIDDAGTTRFLAFVPVGSDGRGDCGVLLMLGRTQVCGALSVEFFARQYGVTTAESAVLSALCNGKSPRAIAEERGIAVSTVRTQISRIRQKTGARSITELLRLASTLPPLVTAAT